MSDSVFAIGLRGMHEGFERAARNAERISKAFNQNSNDNVVDAIVGLKNDVRLVQASAKVITSADRLQGSILDILA